MTRVRRIAAFALIRGFLLCWSSARAQGSGGYAGAQACVSCHAAEADQWQQSHHARAMLDATPDTIQGNFDGAQFVKDGASTMFSRAGGRSMVRTEGPGRPSARLRRGLHVRHRPAAAVPDPPAGGRMQVFGLAWDTRPRDQGGQRWFDLYPGQTLHAGDRLHWTGRDQTWNYQMARSKAKSLSTARSCRAPCIAPASPARTATSRTV
jgi:hypothetical protein